MALVKEILTNNGFPTQLIDNQVKKRLNQIRHGIKLPKDKEIKKFDARLYMTLPYIKGSSENIAHKLKKCGLNTVYTIPKKLNTTITKGKDRLADEKRTDIVYRILCENCNASYIGQTKRHLATRIKEHFNDIKKDVDNHSVVTKHRTNHGHDFHWQSPKILH
ncbi:PREDICTED: uncharacterized protein LOC105570848, partial [Vollenhovia emeryi]|uniref:uncharacterized protein LOC105570848 n=1 Tax=Vollenhovia emeryi TaxID=411798 RepID=UPI0005F3E7AD